MADILPCRCGHCNYPANCRRGPGHYSADLGALWGNALLWGWRWMVWQMHHLSYTHHLDLGWYVSRADCWLTSVSTRWWQIIRLQKCLVCSTVLLTVAKSFDSGSSFLYLCLCNLLVCVVIHLCRCWFIIKDTAAFLWHNLVNIRFTYTKFFRPEQEIMPCEVEMHR